MADNTTRPATSGGDVIRSEEEDISTSDTNVKTQVFRVDSLLGLSVRSGLVGMLEDLRDAKRERLDLLREMLPALEYGAGARVYLPTLGAPNTTVEDILGSRIKRSYGFSVTVSTWTDDSGIANATQADAARQPTIIQLNNGRNAAYFSSDGSFTTNSDVMVATATGSTSTPRYTMIACAMNVASGYANDGSGFATAFAIGGRAVIYMTTADSLVRLGGLGNNALCVGTSAINDGLWHAIVGIVDTNGDGSGSQLYIDGVLQSSATPANDGNGVDLSANNIFLGASDATGATAYSAKLAKAYIAQDASAFAGAEITNVSDALLRYVA